jgi:hypothetical protein
MTELGPKFEPNTVKANAGPPTAVELGFSEIIAGTGLFPVRVKLTAFEVPPPGVGLVTVRATTPGKVAAAAGMVAVSCFELMNVALNAIPPKLSAELATKFVPLIVRVKLPALAAALVGEIVAIAGVGFCGKGGGVFADIPPPHPARNTALTIPRITSALANAFLRFILHLLLGFCRNP